MTLRVFLAAVIAALGAAVPWPGPAGDHHGHRWYTLRAEVYPGVPMKWLASLFLVVALGDPLAAQDTTKAPKLKRQPNVIVVEEIDAIRTEVSTARDIVLRLRPGFLRTRGASSFGNAANGATTPSLQVVVDGAPRAGGPSALDQIPAMTVREIRYINAADASIRYGTGYDAGAILVITR